MHTLSHYGHHATHNFFLAADCIITSTGDFVFPAENMSHYVIGSDEFHLAENMENIPGPVFFPGISHPQAHDLPEDWEQERQVVAAMLDTLILDMQKLIGEGPAEAAIATTLAFLTHHSVARGGKPGLWLHGPKGSGKSIIAEILMRLCGRQNHFPINRDSSPTAYERIFATYSGIPVHIDEWRNVERRGKSRSRENQCNIERLLTNAFTGLAIAKGTHDAPNAIHLVTPLTVPIITGEETSSDHVLLSRYIIITSQPNTSIPRGDHPDSIHSILSRWQEYYRITRFLLRHTPEFIPIAMERVETYIFSNKDIYAEPRLLENHAVIHSAFASALELITAPDPDSRSHYLNSLGTWLKSHYYA